jgi:hypothetical protein
VAEGRVRDLQVLKTPHPLLICEAAQFPMKLSRTKEIAD